MRVLSANDNVCRAFLGEGDAADIESRILLASSLSESCFGGSGGGSLGGICSVGSGEGESVRPTEHGGSVGTCVA
jgi:hypothetical protein